MEILQSIPVSRRVLLVQMGVMKAAQQISGTMIVYNADAVGWKFSGSSFEFFQSAWIDVIHSFWFIWIYLAFCIINNYEKDKTFSEIMILHSQQMIQLYGNVIIQKNLVIHCVLEFCAALHCTRKSDKAFVCPILVLINTSVLLVRKYERFKRFGKLLGSQCHMKKIKFSTVTVVYKKVKISRSCLPELK